MTLPKIANAEKESKFGYVYAVSGPGELEVLLQCLRVKVFVALITCSMDVLVCFSRHSRENVWISYVRAGSCRLR